MIRSRARFYCALSLPRPAETLITREDGNFHPRTIPTGKPWPNGQAAKSRYYLRSSDDNRGQRASSFVAVISRHALRRWTINSSVAARQIWIQKIWHTSAHHQCVDAFGHFANRDVRHHFHRAGIDGGH